MSEKYLQAGRTLATKDGRCIGNAIIAKIKENGFINIITDYGNTATLTQDEVENMFWYGSMALKTHKHHESGKCAAVELTYALNKLWDILDDIDSATDMCKKDEKCYRTRVNALQKKRWELGIHDVNGAIDGHKIISELMRYSEPPIDK